MQSLTFETCQATGIERTRGRLNREFRIGFHANGRMLERSTDASSRRDFLRQGGIGLGGVAGVAALGMQTAQVQAEESSSVKIARRDSL